jgi:hypothetical protein
MGNTLTTAQNNASDSSQFLALAGAAQGQAQQGFENLGMAEAQDQQRRMTNWEQALQDQIGEEDKVFGDEVRRFGNKAQIQGAQAENRANTWGDISNMGFGLADFAQAGGMNGLDIQNPFRRKQTMQPMQFGQGIDQYGLGLAKGHIRSLGR